MQVMPANDARALRRDDLISSDKHCKDKILRLAEGRVGDLRGEISIEASKNPLGYSFAIPRQLIRSRPGVAFLHILELL